MPPKDDQSTPRQRRFYPPARESTGNFLSDASIRGVRAFFQKSIKAAMTDGSLEAFFDEIGYDLVKRPTKKVKIKPRGKAAVPRDATRTDDSKPKAAKRRKRAAGIKPARALRRHPS
jgi:hypothetical protein